MYLSLYKSSEMKRSIFIVAIGLFALYGCEKSTGGNKSILTEETVETEITNNNGNIDSATNTSLEKSVDGKTVEEQSFLYTGLEKSKAKVTIINSEKEKTMIIEASNQKFQLDKKSDNLYERRGIKAEIKGDSLYIIQDDNIIPLKKAF